MMTPVVSTRKVWCQKTVWLVFNLSGLALVSTFQQMMFHQVSTYDGQLCGWNWTFTDARSQMACLANCLSEADCSGIFYNPVSVTCLGVTSQPLQLTGCANDTGSQLFAKVAMPTACNTNSLCSAEFTECRNGTCQCIPGYSLVPSSHACVENCTAYGESFQEFLGWGLQASPLNVYQPVSLEACKALCVNEPVLCRSVNYLSTSHGCMTNQLTPITGQEYYGQYPDADFYFRNCA